MSRRIHLSPVGVVQTESYTVLQRQHKRHLSKWLIALTASINAQSKYHVRKVRCLLERPQKEVNDGRIPEYDFVEEVESAAREPGRTDEGGLAQGVIPRFSKPVLFLTFGAGVDNVLANLDGEATAVHVRE